MASLTVIDNSDCLESYTFRFDLKFWVEMTNMYQKEAVSNQTKLSSFEHNLVTAKIVDNNIFCCYRYRG